MPESPTLDITFTYLEMRSPPPHETLHPSRAERIAIMRAEPPSTGFYRYLHHGVGHSSLWGIRRRWSDEELEAVIESPDVHVDVLYLEGVPGGFRELDMRELPDIEIVFLSLMPELLGRGLDQYWMAKTLDKAWSYEPERVWVRTDSLGHPAALRLYQLFGFEVYRRETKTITDPRAQPDK